jgi:hypothetical protein
MVDIGRPSGLVLYYLASPLFGVADLAFHAPLRVSLVLPVNARVGYYAAVFLLGVLCLLRPGATPWVGMVESAGNLLILMLGILLPIWSLASDPSTVAGGVVGLNGWGAANALLAGGMLTLAFRSHHRQALARPARRSHLPR